MYFCKNKEKNIKYKIAKNFQDFTNIFCDND